MDHLALSLLSTSVEPVNGICPPMETHPLWKLLVKPDNQDFHEFSSLCEKSFCSENLVVWKKLYELFVAWKTKQEKISRYKAELVTKFLGPSAFWPLNLTSDLLEHVSLWVNEPDLTDLDFQYPEGMIARIIAEVFSNLQQDMWVRFLKTKK